jgi:hypothetical protein
MSSRVEVYTTFLNLDRNMVYTGRISHGALRNSFMVLALMIATISMTIILANAITILTNGKSALLAHLTFVSL